MGLIWTGRSQMRRNLDLWRTDPDFDSTQPAFYYVRVIENPVCRWTTWECLRMDPENRPESCDYEEIPKTVQERAWSSPIWYTPDKIEEHS